MKYNHSTWKKAKSYLGCFIDGEGAEVLKDLEERFSNRSSFVPGDPHHTSQMEGHREVYLHIMVMMKIGMGAEPDIEAEENARAEALEEQRIEGA